MKIDLAATKAAAKTLRSVPATARSRALGMIGEFLSRNEASILAENAKDLAALPSDATDAFRDRLTLSPARLAGMKKQLEVLVAMPDPVGEIVEEKTLPGGVKVKRERVALGVCLIIFESRPNVAIEAFSVAFKGGNAAILRGGKESARTCAALYFCIHDALKAAGLPAATLTGVTDPDRELLKNLLAQKDSIDVVVPRGGDALINFVSENAKMPVIKNDRGMCHVYLHADADAQMAIEIVRNAKTQRPGVCNSMETLLVHKDAVSILPKIFERITKNPEGHPAVEWRVCARSAAAVGAHAKVKAATPADYDTEHLDYILNVKVVDSLDEAIVHIEKHGSRHSEAIITKDAVAARRFEREIDAAAVYWNASTRFTDGFELGLGGEIGISTQKLHARGPVGPRELTSIRWVLEGTGQIR